MSDPAGAKVEPARVRPLRLVIVIQGLSYLIVGLWPLLHFSSFSSVAGPKPDRYQFFATDLLVLAIALSLLMGSLPVRRTDPVDRGPYTLALATPVAFILVELWFLGTLPDIYRVDFAFEFVFLLFLVYFGLKARSKSVGAHIPDRQSWR